MYSSASSYGPEPSSYEHSSKIFDEWKTNLMSLAILFHLLCAQHVSDINHTKHTTTHRKVTLKLKHPSLQNKTTDVVIHQHSRKLLKMDILMSETCWAHNKWNKIASDIKLVFHSSRSRMLGVYRCACRVLCCGTVETLFSLSQRIKTFISFICCNVLWCGLRKICRVFMHLTSWLYWAACSSLFIFNTDL